MSASRCIVGMLTFTRAREAGGRRVALLRVQGRPPLPPRGPSKQDPEASWTFRPGRNQPPPPFFAMASRYLGFGWSTGGLGRFYESGD
jgi:hypothetical protein